MRKGLLLYREGGLGLWVHGRFWGCAERLVSIVLFVRFKVMLVGNNYPFPYPLLLLPFLCPVPVFIMHLYT